MEKITIDGTEFPVVVAEVPCRFGCPSPSVAVGRYTMDAGCLCYPDDREQDLCAQHVLRANPRGSMELVQIHQPSFYASYFGAK